MHIEVLEIKDKEDGSCTIELDMDKEAHDLLIEWSVVEALKNGIAKHESSYE